ncbi:Permease of the drug/metabolite transporter (DMT) superfamily [Paramagnetospirillum magnetotacticum MS-1]|uniref:Permease of the drug/metabolite transporter (DMT) superfamily n=1 Tax=Paramagnetospirillum magnetotacticum MS-1 TaxID=272627 RepID=A0A0C2UWC2_PARME|nr:DMT family transporter [Paramagnetospirillum magnetotacticum]KIL97091.1 Permease of the drug/metabolite transporter (DMT) superfamily [Paramagnetospirillum magnetotacticum MS-1]
MGQTGIYALAVLSALFWAANFNLAGPVLADMAPMTAAAGRFGLAALVMAALVAGRGELGALMGAARKSGGRLALLGVVGIAGFNLLFFDAMRTTSAVNGALIMATNPLLTAVLAAMFLGEQLPGRQIAALPVALAGVSMVILGGVKGDVVFGMGDVEMMGANLSWAIYNVMARRLMPAGSALVNATIPMAAGALVLALAAGLSGAEFAIPGPKAGAALLAMVVFGSVLAYLFWNAAIARMGAGRTALFLNLVPVFAAAIATLGGTPPSPAQLGGGAVVIAAVIISMLPRRPQPCLA